jgi:carboxymethylenebutenolidase
LLSVRKPDLLKAVIAFYGTGLWLQSEYTVARASYLGHYAELDEWEPVEEVRGTQEALRVAGHEVTFYTYPSVGHWFFEEDRPAYDAGAARLAWERTVGFLQTRIGPA